eukprot:CAMPEP_0168333872 /NCGR_PEP_ID=MMETSP0213-20121227/9887_1 /TAXON_ID=151035 /ORGANISM="Euplotes harpa, Strain FSP1.4" /LENGTH=314 /DNA_ID=CAMNT_0008338321 /DNA_START=16 /DNA_END=961 /DNA_ORIENTATION=+
MGTTCTSGCMEECVSGKAGVGFPKRPILTTLDEEIRSSRKDQTFTIARPLYRGSKAGTAVDPGDIDFYDNRIRFEDFFNSPIADGNESEDEETIFAKNNVFMQTITLHRPGASNVSANKRVMEILKPYISEELRSLYAKFKPFSYKTTDFTKLDVKLSSLEMRELFGTDSANFSSKPDGVDSTQADLDKYCNLYLGQWNKRSNKPEGFGVALYKFKGLYEGFWKKGKPHSFGKMFYLNGEVYQGQWKKGEIHGYGIFLKNAVKNKDSTKLVNNQNEQKINAHQGFWVQGKANGIGFQKFADGSTFLGTFEDNKK